MRALDVLTLLAAYSAVSRLEPVEDVSAHVSSILAGSLLLFSQMLGGPGPAPACPPLSLHPILKRFQEVLDLGNSHDLCLEQVGHMPFCLVSM